jgi:hypothetical protein
VKRFLLILTLGLSLLRETQAQSFFNIRDPLHSGLSILTSVYPDADGRYYCTGLAWDSVNYIGGSQAWYVIGVKYAVYDASGHKLRDTIYQRSFVNLGLTQGRLIRPWFNTLHRTADKSFVLAAFSYDYDTPFNIRAAIIRLDSTGKCTMFREYEKPFCQSVRGDFSHAIRDLKPDGHGGWLLLTNPLCGSAPYRHYDWALTRLDSAFNVVWDKQYGDVTLTDIATKILVEPDGYVLAGGLGNYNIADKNFIHRAKLIKTDTAGNVLWTWLSSPSQKIYSAADVIRTADGGYVYCGWGDGFERLSANGSSGTMYWHSWIEKLNSNRNSIWSRTLSPIRWGYGTNELAVLKEMPNGDIAVAGGLKHRPSLADSFTQGYGQLARLAPDGAIRWQRRYRYASDTFEHTVHDMRLAPDGGFVLVGQSTDQKYPYNPPTQQGWIIKVDSNGCLGPSDSQCWPMAIAPVISKKESALVYPNPAASTLNVRYQPLSGQLGAECPACYRRDNPGHHRVPGRHLSVAHSGRRN